MAAQASLVREHDLGLVVSVDDVEGAAAAIRDWTPERITSARLDEAGLTWRHERAKLASLYDELGL